MKVYEYNRQGSKAHWAKTELKNILDKMQDGEILKTNSPFSLACSTSQILEIFSMVCAKGLGILFSESGKELHSHIPNIYLLQLLSETESKFVSMRTTEALAKRKAKGLPLGRPKGRLNKSLILDEHQKEILKFLGLGVTKSSIAKILGCHPQTLYDYIRRKGLVK